MAGQKKPTFRVKSIKQLVRAATPKESTEPAYRFSNGRTFSRKVKR